MERNQEPLFDDRIREIVRHAGEERALELGWRIGNAIACAAEWVATQAGRFRSLKPAARG